MNSNEERYSINELQLLGVVLSIENIKNYFYGKEFSIITDHRALLSILKDHRTSKSYNSRLSRWVDQFKIEHLPGAMMGLVDCIFRNTYQPAKSLFKYDEKFFVATWSRIQADAKLLQQEKHISAVKIDKFYLDTKTDIETPSIQQIHQVLKINTVKPKSLTQNFMLFAPQSPSSDLPLKHNHNFIIDKAIRVRCTQINSILTKQKFNRNFIPFNYTIFHSPHSSRVHLTQNKLSPAQHSNTFKPNTNNHKIFDCDFDPRVRFTQNKLTLTGHNLFFY